MYRLLSVQIPACTEVNDSLLFLFLGAFYHRAARTQRFLRSGKASLSHSVKDSPSLVENRRTVKNSLALWIILWYSNPNDSGQQKSPPAGNREAFEQATSAKVLETPVAVLRIIYPMIRQRLCAYGLFVLSVYQFKHEMSRQKCDCTLNLTIKCEPIWEMNPGRLFLLLLAKNNKEPVAKTSPLSYRR